MVSKEDETRLHSVTADGTPRELIFIQAGPASNWIGTHFWNLQDSCFFQASEDSCFYFPALFRAKERGFMRSFQPRLIAIDTLGGVRGPQIEFPPTIPRSVNMAWSGSIQTISQSEKPQAMKPNECPSQNEKFRAPVSRFWTDCLLPTMRRRLNAQGTFIVLREYLDSSSPGDVFASGCTYTPCNSDESPSLFSLFPQGYDLYHSGSQTFELFEEYFHRLVEECDRPSGFSLLVDSDSGFAGVGLRLGEFLGEEFAKRPIFTSAIGSCLPSNFSRRWSAVCLNRLALFTAMEEATNWPSCSAWMPVADTGDPCVASSRLAAGLTTLLTPMCLERGHRYSSEMHGFVAGLTPTRKKMMSLSVVSQDSSMGPLCRQKWTHANTFGLCGSGTQESSKPRSLLCQFSTRGSVIDECAFLSHLPHPGGHACCLGEGSYPQLSCAMPSAPLSVAKPTIPTSPCLQPAYSRAHVLLEAVSHWTETTQWLACGLKLHMDCAFRKFHTTCLETDELRQLQETAFDRLVEAYASADG